MIGRGCLKNPFIFRQATALRAGQPMDALEEPLDQLLQKLLGHLEAFYDERLVLIQMRKFAAWYSSGFNGAAAFRKELFQTQDRAATWARSPSFSANCA